MAAVTTARYQLRLLRSAPWPGETSTAMQKFVISGGFGLLGQRILRHILSTGRGRVRILVVDTAPYVQPADKAGPFGDEAVSVVTGDLGCTSVAAAIKSFVSADVESNSVAAAAAAATSLSVFHLASVMSGQGEQDFDEALRVNVDGTEPCCMKLHRVNRLARGKLSVESSQIGAFDLARNANDSGVCIYHSGIFL